MSHSFILIPGRSARQGVTLNEGKYTDGYLDEISTLRMNPHDMQRLQLSAGDHVRLRNTVGSIEVPVISGKEELPEGMLFICYGDLSSQLMGGETHGSGMPDSKGLDVELEVVATTSGSPAVSASAEAQTASTTPEAKFAAAAVVSGHGAISGTSEQASHPTHSADGKSPATAILLLAALFIVIALLLSMFSGS